MDVCRAIRKIQTEILLCPFVVICDIYYMLRLFTFLCLVMIISFGYAREQVITDTLLVKKGYVHFSGDTFNCARNAVIIVSDFAHLEIDQCSFTGAKGWQGIVVEKGGSLRVQNSTICDAKFAIQIIGAAGTVTIKNNKFERNQVAVQVYMPQWYFSVGITIQNNRITVNPQGKPGKGISVQSITAVKVPRGKRLEIISNTIQLQNGTTGIDLNGLSGTNDRKNINAIILSNRIWCEDRMLSPPNNNNRYGILVSNSKALHIGSNTVSRTYPGAVPSPPLSAGSGNLHWPWGLGFNLTAAENVSDIIVECNEAYNMGVGYKFNSLNTLVFRGNDIGEQSSGAANRIGLHVTNGGVIGQQANRGNKWWGAHSGANNNWAAWNGNPVLIDPNTGLPNTVAIRLSQFFTNNNGSFDPRSTATGTNPVIEPNALEWVDNLSTDSPFTCTPSQTPPALVGGISDFAQMVISGSYEPELYPEVSKWLAAREVYGLLCGMKDSLAPNSPEQMYYDSLLNTNIAWFKEVGNMMQANSPAEVALFESIATIDSVIEPIRRQLFLKDSLIGYWLQLPDSVLADSLKQAAVNQLMAERAGLVEDFEVQTTERDSLLTKLTTQRSLQAVAAKEYNSNLVTNYTFEQYKKTVNDVYLSSIAVGMYYFSDTQAEQLEEIASKCFLEAGEAVFEARAMLSLYGEGSWDDYDVCAEQENAMKTDEEAKADSVRQDIIFYMAYPVPAKDKLMIRLTGSAFTGEEIEITDRLGRVMILQRTAASGNVAHINTEALSGGTYQLRVKLNNSIVHQQKIVIIK